MTIPSTNPLAPSVAYTPIGTSSTGSATEVKKISATNESGPSSSHTITVIHPPQDPGSSCPLLEEGTVAPANSEIALEPPSEALADEDKRSQSIFRRCFCCK